MKIKIIFLLAIFGLIVNSIFLDNKKLSLNRGFIEYVNSVPSEVFGWKKVSLNIQESIFADINTYNAVLFKYVNPNYNFYPYINIVYSDGKNSFHPPEYCYVGVGEYEFVDKKDIKLTVDKVAIPVRQMRFRVRSNGKEFLVLYLFMNKGETLTNYYLQRLLGVFSRFNFINSEWVMIRITVYLPENDFKTVEKQTAIIFGTIYNYMYKFLNS